MGRRPSNLLRVTGRVAWKVSRRNSFEREVFYILIRDGAGHPPQFVPSSNPLLQCFSVSCRNLTGVTYSSTIDVVSGRDATNSERTEPLAAVFATAWHL